MATLLFYPRSVMAILSIIDRSQFDSRPNMKCHSGPRKRIRDVFLKEREILLLKTTAALEVIAEIGTGLRI